jgi:signal peptidase I
MAKRADRRRREIERFRASNEPEEGTALESTTKPSIPGKASEQPRAAGAKTRTKKTAKHPKSLAASLIELAAIVTVAILLALLIQAFIVKPYRIPSGSMEPTLRIGQRVLVNRISADFSGPHVGEIAVFHPPIDAEEPICGPSPHRVMSGRTACSQAISTEDKSVNFIKRIVAGPGDEIYISGGHAYRKAAGTKIFVKEKDPYIAPCEPVSLPECNFPNPIKIPAGHWFMMGDNRGHSDDSRFWGSVPASWIIGGAVATYWPPDRIGLL